MNSIGSIAERHFDNCRELPSSAITLSAEVRKLCEQNSCGQYGKNWTCPPAVQSIDDFRRQMAPYDTFLVVYQVYGIKTSLDWNGMMAGGVNFRERLLALKHEVEAAEPQRDFLVLGAGGCHLCDPCAYVTGEPCRNPDDAVVSLEACGIDVMGLMRENGLKYYNGKNTVTFIGGVLYKS